jgi:transposase
VCGDAGEVGLRLLVVVEHVVTDELWARLEPLIPVPERRYRFPGRHRVDNRAALEGILFVISTGMRWNDLPTTMFGASGATCWRRLKEWYEAGVWQQLHEVLLAELRAAGLLDLAYAVVDSSHLRALKGGTSPVPARSTGAGWVASTT